MRGRMLRREWMGEREDGGRTTSTPRSMGVDGGGWSRTQNPCSFAVMWSASSYLQMAPGRRRGRHTHTHTHASGVLAFLFFLSLTSNSFLPTFSRHFLHTPFCFTHCALGKKQFEQIFFLVWVIVLKMAQNRSSCPHSSLGSFRGTRTHNRRKPQSRTASAGLAVRTRVRGFVRQNARKQTQFTQSAREEGSE